MLFMALYWMLAAIGALNHSYMSIDLLFCARKSRLSFMYLLILDTCLVR